MSSTARELPRSYALAAFWSGQEGSLLLWLLILTAFSSAAVLLARRRGGRELAAWATPLLGLVASGFAFLVVFVASPFATQIAPPEGSGMTPSLQNPYMLAHPPMLYLGYVGLTVPFAFAMGALLARRTDERWIVATRRWTLAAWAFLGVGQLLGSRSSEPSTRPSKRIFCLRRAESRNRLVVMRCSQPSKVPGV